MDKFLLFIRFRWGIGAGLILTTYLYDPIMTGFRGFYEWNMGYKAHIIMGIGIIWLVVALLVDKNWGKK